MNPPLELHPPFCNHQAIEEQMHSADVDKILELVKEKTGYPVTVSLAADMPLHSKMQSASESRPVHLIHLNPKFDQMGNYLVANQCAMLLIKWADPEHVPEFSHRNEDIQSLARKLCPEPIQIMAAEWIWREFPSLRDEQVAHITADLREASACLAPKVREASPKAVFERSVIMGSAYAAWWSRMTGSNIALLPYRAMGFLSKGQELLDAMNSIPADDGRRWPKVVDAWAARLDMAGFYRWSIRKV
jgi:hypothetical protein